MKKYSELLRKVVIVVIALNIVSVHCYALEVDVTVGDLFKAEVMINDSEEEVDIVRQDNTAVPTWLHYEPLKNLLYGVPSESDVGELSLNILSNNSVIDSLNINIVAIDSVLTIEEIESDNLFINDILVKESNFQTPGVGFNGVNGITYDGININRDTLELSGTPRQHTASSKESLHINILIKAILGNARAQILIAGESVESAEAIALEILEKKITAYEEFNLNYPAFGGYLPWFNSTSGFIQPQSDWSHSTPSLDNGQLAWSLYFAYKSLNKKGHTALAQRYFNHFDLMARNAKTMFYSRERKAIIGVTSFTDQKLAPEQQNYNKESYELLDAFEGELMVVFMTLFSPDLTEDEKKEIWEKKFINIRTYQNSEFNNISVIEGWAFSSHEQWKYLILPYLDYSKAKELFLNGEKVRSDYSNRNSFEGFFASVHNSQLEYVGKLGVQAVSSETVGTSVTAPYATFPILIADQITGNNVGLQWLRNVLSFDGMIGPNGMTEAFDTSTFNIAPVLTWDGKVTTNLALIGGVYNETREYLIEDGLYLTFIDFVESEYDKITEPVLGQELTIPPPSAEPEPDNDSVGSRSSESSGGPIYPFILCWLSVLIIYRKTNFVQK